MIYRRRIFIFLHPLSPGWLTMSISHVLCSQEWGDPVRLRIVTHDQSLCGACFAILQTLLIVALYRQIYDFRWRLQAWWEHWVRSPQTTVVSLNEWLPLHSTSSLFSLLKKEFVVPWTWAGRWQGLSQTSHTCFLIDRSEVFNNQWQGFFSQ